MRVLCYVQHLMGIGHQHRMAAISRALCARGAEVTYVSGGMPLPALERGAVRLVQLPPARAADLTYKRLVDAHGMPVTEAWRRARRRQLLATYRACRPDALLIETFPFGRRMLRFELVPLLEAARAERRPPVVLASVRDIIEHRGCAERAAEILAYLRRYFDLVLVHADPALVPFELSFPPARELAGHIRYTGYVLYAPPNTAESTLGAGEVVVSAGGGGYGQHVLRTAMQTRPLTRLHRSPWRILAGEHLATARFEALRRVAAPGVTVERNRPDFPTLLRNCRLSISQGGYNTIVELLSVRARAVVVPYCDEREGEQALRAERLAQRGLVHVVDNHRLCPEALACAVDTADTAPPRRPRRIDTAGAERSAQLVLAAAMRLHGDETFG